MKKSRRILHSLTACLTALLFTLGIPFAAMANELPKVVDNAGVLSGEEISKLDQSLNAISDSYGLDVVIVTDTNENISSAMDTADDLFDYGGYGVGEDRSGVLLYVNFSTRDWWISTRGYGLYVFTDAGIEYIGEQITDDLGNGNYMDAFSGFASLCEDFIIQAKDGHPYTADNLPKGPFPGVEILIISVVVGLVVALIYALVLRGQLKSVAPQDSAVDYITQGSVNVRDAGSIFLYRNVTRTERPKETSSPASSTHTSSSGATHGGGGGKF